MVTQIGCGMRSGIYFMSLRSAVGRVYNGLNKISLQENFAFSLEKSLFNYSLLIFFAFRDQHNHKTTTRHPE